MNQKSQKRISGLLVLVLVVLTPLLMSYLYNGVWESNEQYTTLFIQSTYLLCFPLMALFFITRNALTLFFFGVGYFLVMLQFFLLSMHWHLFKQPVNASTMFIVLESNLAESTEFMSIYFDGYIISQIALILTLAFLGPWFVRSKSKAFKFPKVWIGVVLLAITLSGAALVFMHTKLSENSLISMATTGYAEYLEESSKYDEFGFHESLGQFKPYDRQPIDDKETYVIIIGESTARSHMSLYDYYRDTNPKLRAIRNNLMVYSDVIAPHTHTIPSLTEILTPGDSEDAEKKFQGSIVQLFNAAGFKTYWFSNQRPVGIYENLITKIAKASDQKVFINNARNSVQTPYDSVLVPLVERAVNESDVQKKAIFVHLMGAHADYKYRYPPHYRKYSRPSKRINFPSDKATALTNQYDEAIVYNDMVVRSIIDQVQNSDGSSAVLYFSDHGEDVYEARDCACHTEKVGTKPMFEVPFLLWRSEAFKSNKPIANNTASPYMLDDLFHGMIDLAGLKYTGFDPTRSIFHESFTPRPRLIQNSIDFDTKFNTVP
ncbi:MAG: phosphoethanolamine transferase CptA [Salibacteraceae bacterium]